MTTTPTNFKYCYLNFELSQFNVSVWLDYIGINDSAIVPPTKLTSCYFGDDI